MAIYICPKCGYGVSTSENHICLFKKPISDVPEHVKKYSESIGWTSKNMNRVWY